MFHYLFSIDGVHGPAISIMLQMGSKGFLQGGLADDPVGIKGPIPFIKITGRRVNSTGCKGHLRIDYLGLEPRRWINIARSLIGTRQPLKIEPRMCHMQRPEDIFMHHLEVGLSRHLFDDVSQ